MKTKKDKNLQSYFEFFKQGPKTISQIMGLHRITRDNAYTRITKLRVLLEDKGFEIICDETGSEPTYCLKAVVTHQEKFLIALKTLEMQFGINPGVAKTCVKVFQDLQINLGKVHTGPIILVPKTNGRR